MTDYSDESDKFLHSSYYEKLVEHLFIADILKTAWINGRNQIEIARSEIDNSGYDLIIESNGVIRHVQLKCSDVHSKTSSQKVNVALAKKPCGCVIWIKRELDFSLAYSFFGNGPQTPLNLEGFKTAVHTKGDASGEKKERPNIRVVNSGSFEKVKCTNHLLKLLFELDATNPFIR